MAGKTKRHYPSTETNNAAATVETKPTQIETFKRQNIEKDENGFGYFEITNAEYGASFNEKTDTEENVIQFTFNVGLESGGVKTKTKTAKVTMHSSAIFPHLLRVAGLEINTPKNPVQKLKVHNKINQESFLKDLCERITGQYYKAQFESGEFKNEQDETREYETPKWETMELYIDEEEETTEES